LFELFVLTIMGFVGRGKLLGLLFRPLRPSTASTNLASVALISSVRATRL
jgi:hypothetical protein